MKKLRLLLTKDCPNNCAGCCNKDWDIDNLPICKSFKGYDIIMITGGEPMLYPQKVIELILDIRYQNKEAKIILYTTKFSEVVEWDIDYELDGLTMTLHNQADADLFVSEESKVFLPKKLSARLNVFKGISLPRLHNNWIIKENIEWIVNCPLPEGEVFMKL